MEKPKPTRVDFQLFLRAEVKSSLVIILKCAYVYLLHIFDTFFLLLDIPC